MPIAFRCKCGEAYNVADTLAGQELRCLACEAKLVVPATSADNEVVSDCEVVDEDLDAPYRLADDPRPVIDDEPDVVDDDPDVVEELDEVGEPEYFVAASPSKAYRVYPYRDELLVLDAGPFQWALAGVLASRSGMAKAGGRADDPARAAMARRTAALDRL